ncbi:MAG: DUF3108 domain-containing protein [Flavobacteriales bacterium]|nr:DUF3108 domain-containing protein [Flavobacteriales bacterium]
MNVQYLISIWITFICFGIKAQTGCEISNKPFQDGELLTYNVSYDWGFITLNAGEVVFEVNEENKFDNRVYHLEGTGRTYENYDWMYKVRDKYDTWVDTTDLSTFLFYRTANEGGKKYANYYTFNREIDSIYTKSITEKETVYDTLAYENCLFDVLSLVYYCRTIDFTSLELNQKIPLTLILDGKRTEIYVRYLGTELQEIEDIGTFNTVKFSALLIEGAMFSGGEDMYIWLTDDKNRFPVRVQADILIGSVNAILKEYSSLKYPLTSIINE